MSGLFNDENKARKYVEENSKEDKLIFNVVAECTKRCENLGSVGIAIIVQTENGIIASSGVNKKKIEDYDHSAFKKAFDGLMKKTEEDAEYKKLKSKEKIGSGISRDDFEIYAQDKLGKDMSKEMLEWADKKGIFGEDGMPNIDAVRSMFRKAIGDEDDD